MRITIDIPDELHARLKARAKQEGTTMRAIILRAIDAVLNEKEPTPTLPTSPKLQS
jgi:predicted DNA-binding protein